MKAYRLCESCSQALNERLCASQWQIRSQYFTGLMAPAFSYQRHVTTKTFAQLTVGSRPLKVLVERAAPFSFRALSFLVPHSSPSYNLSTPQELHDWQYRLPRFTPSRTSLQSDRETSHLLLKRGGWFAGKSCQLFPMDCRSGRAMPIFVSCMDVAVDVEVLTPGIDCWVTRCTCTSQRFFA
jgi:hypothetical protein